MFGCELFGEFGKYVFIEFTPSLGVEFDLLVAGALIIFSGRVIQRERSLFLVMHFSNILIY